MVFRPELLLAGLSLGAAYALAALGFVLIINAVGAVNFAQGDFVMAGGYVAVVATALLPPSLAPGLLALPLVLVAMAVLGLLFSALAYLPLRGQPAVAVFISTIAVGLITDAAQAEAILQEEKADIAALARELLWHSDWPLHAARDLGVDPFALQNREYAHRLEIRERAKTMPINQGGDETAAAFDVLAGPGVRPCAPPSSTV